MTYSLIEEKRLNAIEARIDKILGKLSEPSKRAEESEIEFLTIAKVADLLCWSRAKVSQEINSGNIRSHRMGGRVTILKSELIEDLKKH